MWGWVLGALVLVGGAAVVLGLLARRLWQRLRALLRELARAGVALGDAAERLDASPDQRRPRA